jgi:hypothetical protein
MIRFAVALGCTVIAASAAAESPRWHDWPPSGPPPAPWREVRYAGRTHYTVVSSDSGRVLDARAEDAHSALLHPYPVDPRGLTLRWRWRTLAEAAGADPSRRNRDDRAAAVVVIVRRHWLPWRTRALIYQWSTAAVAGRWERSPWSGEVRVLTLRDAAPDSLWREESRDVGRDLAVAFGEVPATIEAIGVLADSDQTGGVSHAQWAWLRPSRD